jgi:hypothetical protein
MLNLLSPVADGGPLPRRAMLQAGGAGLLGASLPGLLQAEALQVPRTPGRARSAIFLFLFGGPSQFETFDLKPEAPARVRGPFQPIDSRTPGLRISEMLPRTAQVSDRFCVLRTLSHNYNDHSTAAHYLQTGHPWHVPIGGGFNATPRDWPSIGSVYDYVLQRSRGGGSPDLPHYMVVPNFLGRLEEYTIQLVRPGQYAGWLGPAFDPLCTAVDKRAKGDNPYFRACSDDELRYEIEGLLRPREMTLDRLEKRRSLLAQFDAETATVETATRARPFSRFQERAWGLVSSERTRTALDLQREPAPLRDRYGRHLFGQSTLLARRLIEPGVRFVTVHWETVDGYSWDSHRNSDDVRKHLLPGLDSALSTLLEDLDERGLLDETLFVCLGEMGRTARANDVWGRDHWSMLFPAVIAGAGVRGGTTFGTSDKDGQWPADRAIRPEDLAATIYHALGIDPHLQLPDAQGRPTSIVAEGEPLLEIFGS